MSVPKEAVETVWAFFDALMEENDAALTATLAPESDAALLYELFGEAALYAASAALRGPCVVRLTRALVLGDDLWLEGEQVTQDTRETIGHVVFRVRSVNGGWRISEILPWHLEAVHYPSDRPDPQSDIAVGVFLTSYGLQVAPTAQLDGVEQVLIGTMQQEYYPLSSIARAVRMWRDFRKNGELAAHTEAAWAAAVHRAMDRMVLVEEPLEQIALLYGVPLEGVADAYNRLVHHLGLTFFDARYSPMPDPSELLRQAKAAGMEVDESAIPPIANQPLPEEVVR
ncbi:hypothetical protein HRbin17_01349 [bacterium HR17]|uniref:Uncharacterized protein n=1 Tax=Candidatus Fervidibacter japonicus TaxID=2035412 RepID=A0A2H5XCE0_9BACT|nr:hypothetical protein HRbin17_01349 [bacterium HR17]